MAESRSIGLYHTSGLSTPSKVFMDMLALSHMVYAAKGEEDAYIRLSKETVHERYVALMNALGLEADDSAANGSCERRITIAGVCNNYMMRTMPISNWQEGGPGGVDLASARKIIAMLLLKYEISYNACLLYNTVVELVRNTTFKEALS
jgi:hypothetical protein